MYAALRFSPGQALLVAVLALAFVLVVIWGAVEARRDRVRRARERQYVHEARHVRGEDE